MKRYWLAFLLVFFITACASPAIPNLPATAISTSTEIPPTETPAPTSTITQTPTTAPTETPQPTDTPAATPTYDFKILSIHDEEIDGFIPLDLTDTPLTEFCGAPIFDKAIAGSRDPSKDYYYMTDAHPMDVYEYYMTEIPKQGGELVRISDGFFDNIPLDRANLDEFHSSMLFLNDATSKDPWIFILKDFDSGLIYVWIMCN